MKKKLLFTSLLLSALSTSTVAIAKSPSWNNVGVGYINVDIDDVDYEPSGFALFGSHLVNENIYVHAKYLSTEDDIFGEDLEITTLNLGLGYRHSLNVATDLFGEVSYLSADAEYNNQSEDENGYSLAIGVKSMLTENVEGVLSASRDSIDGESDTAINLELSYFVSEQFSFGAGYSFSDEANSLSLGIKVHF